MLQNILKLKEIKIIVRDTKDNSKYDPFMIRHI